MNLCLSSGSSEKLFKQCLACSDSGEDIIVLSDIWLALCLHQATAAATEVVMQSCRSCWLSFSYPIRTTCIRSTLNRLYTLQVIWSFRRVWGSSVASYWSPWSMWSRTLISFPPSGVPPETLVYHLPFMPFHWFPLFPSQNIFCF